MDYKRKRKAAGEEIKGGGEGSKGTAVGGGSGVH